MQGRDDYSLYHILQIPAFGPRFRQNSMGAVPARDEGHDPCSNSASLFRLF